MAGTPRVGDEVFFMGGARLGTVEIVRARTMRVRTDSSLIWLSLESVFTTAWGEVTLVCELQGLSSYTRPAVSPADRRRVAVA